MVHIIIKVCNQIACNQWGRVLRTHFVILQESADHCRTYTKKNVRQLKECNYCGGRRKDSGLIWESICTQSIWKEHTGENVRTRSLTSTVLRQTEVSKEFCNITTELCVHFVHLISKGNKTKSTDIKVEAQNWPETPYNNFGPRERIFWHYGKNSWRFSK